MDASSTAAVRQRAPAPIPFPDQATQETMREARLRAESRRTARSQHASAAQAERTKVLLRTAYDAGMHTGQRSGWFNGLRNGFWLGAAAATFTVGPLVGFFVWLGSRP